MADEFELDFPDKNGKRTVWTKESFEEHAIRRPELRNKSIQDRIKRALQQPTEIIGCHKNNNYHCFYYLEYKSGLIARYTKVIVDTSRAINYIKTAYRPDRIKELDYNMKPVWQEK